MADTNCRFSGKESVILWEFSFEGNRASIETKRDSSTKYSEIRRLVCAVYTSRVKVSTFDLSGRACEVVIS